MKPKDDLKPYVVRKIVFASSLSEAVKKEKIAPIVELYIEPDWLKQYLMSTKDKRGELGF